METVRRSEPQAILLAMNRSLRLAPSVSAEFKRRLQMEVANYSVLFSFFFWELLPPLVAQQYSQNELGVFVVCRQPVDAVRTIGYSDNQIHEENEHNRHRTSRILPSALTRALSKRYICASEETVSRLRVLYRHESLVGRDLGRGSG